MNQSGHVGGLLVQARAFADELLGLHVRAMARADNPNVAENFRQARARDVSRARQLAGLLADDPGDMRPRQLPRARELARCLADTRDLADVRDLARFLELDLDLALELAGNLAGILTCLADAPVDGASTCLIFQRVACKASRRLVFWAVGRLPIHTRARYLEEFLGELRDLADQSRWRQVVYGLRVLGRGVALRRALRGAGPGWDPSR